MAALENTDLHLSMVGQGCNRTKYNSSVEADVESSLAALATVFRVTVYSPTQAACRAE